MKRYFKIFILLITLLIYNPTNSMGSYIYGNINISINSNRYYTLSNPFDNGTNTLNSLIPSAPNGTRILIWNTPTASYITSTNINNQWTINFFLPPGVGFYIISPQNTTLAFSGKIIVPIGGSITNNIPAGYDMVGSAIPFSDTLQGTNLNLFELSDGSYVHLWYGTTYTHSFINGGVFDPDYIIYPAEGFFIYSPSNFAWIETLPFPITTNTAITYITNQNQTIQTNISYTYTTNGDTSSKSVTLAWDAVTNAPVAGYNIYYGSSSRNYTNITHVGNVTNAIITGLNQGYTFYFVATTLGTSGSESAYSLEVFYTVPINYTIITNSFTNYITNIIQTIQTNIVNTITTNANFPFSWYITNSSPSVPSVENVYSTKTAGGVSTLSTNINVTGNNTVLLLLDDWYSASATPKVPTFNGSSNSVMQLTNFLWYKDSNAHAVVWYLKNSSNGVYQISSSWSSSIDEGSMTILIITNFSSFGSMITTNVISSASQISLTAPSQLNELRIFYSILSDTGHTPTMGTRQNILSQTTTSSGQHQNVVSYKISTNSIDTSSITWSSGSGYPSGNINFGIKGN